MGTKVLRIGDVKLLGALNEGGVINMQAVQKVARIEAIINRLDDRGAELMGEAIANCRSPRFDDYVARIAVITKRCQRMARYINGLSGPRRRSA